MTETSHTQSFPTKRLDLGFAKFLVLRVLFAMLVIVVLTIIVFTATSLMPVNAVEQMLGSEITPAGRAAMMREFGLDRPPVERYFTWAGAALQFDFGRSMFSRLPVMPLVMDRLQNSLVLAGAIMLVQTPLALWLGIWTAIKRGGQADRTVSSAVLFFICIPEFVTGIFLIWVFSITFPILPALSMLTAQTSGWDWFRALCLPVVAMLPVGTSYLIRTMRFSMIEVMDREFIRMAGLRGLSRSRVLFRHALPNAMIPMVNVMALHVAFLLSGLVAVEVLFLYPGIGKLLLDAVSQQDVPMVQGVALIVGIGYVLINLAADIVMALLDPRIGQRMA